MLLINLNCASPAEFFFHGGSGSDIGDIKEAISYGTHIAS